MIYNNNNIKDERHTIPIYRKIMVLNERTLQTKYTIENKIQRTHNKMPSFKVKIERCQLSTYSFLINYINTYIYYCCSYKNDFLFQISNKNFKNEFFFWIKVRYNTDFLYLRKKKKNLGIGIVTFNIKYILWNYIHTLVQALL